MLQKVSAPVSLVFKYDHHRRQLVPLKVTWEGRDYPVKKIGLHHRYRQGRTLYHVFSVVSPTLFFKLVFDTETLNWRVEEIGDSEVG